MAKIAKLNKPLVNRIVGHGEEQVDQLLANPLNFRLHPDQQQQALAGAMDDIGFIRSVTVNKRTGRVVDGHLRVTIAARSNVESLPVEYVDLDEAEEAQALLSLDPIAALAATDKAKLDELMRSVQSDDERVQTMMAELAEREGLEYGKAEKQDDPGAQVDRAEELREKWGVELGQLWQLGEHKLICGDCTDAAVVDRLMGGEKAGMAIMDPPYGMNLDADYSKMPQATVKGKKYDAVIGDDVDFDFSVFQDLECKEQFWWGADYYCQQLPKGGSWLVWDKRNEKNDEVIGSGFELCWSKTPHKRSLLRYLWSGVTARDPGETRVHPTQKPIAMYEELIGDHSDKGAIVADWYLGSGTTLIACERLGRKCRAVEISPAYVAVALQRWSDMTGHTPELIG